MAKRKHLKAPYIEPIVQVNSPDGRYYVKDGRRYESVSRMAGIWGLPGIQAWREEVGEEKADNIKMAAAKLGTKVHKCAEMHLNGEEVPKQTLEAQALYDCLKPELEKINNITGLEKRVYSDEYGFAGTFDCIAEYEGKKVVLDFKTSKEREEYDEEKYFLQAASYSQMWEELTGEKVDDLVVILLIKKVHKVKVLRAKREDYEKRLQETMEHFRNELAAGRA